MSDRIILNGYEYAQETYNNIGVDVEAALKQLESIPLSMQCWQGDDVAGFDCDGKLDGGIATTGHYPGLPRSLDELRDDIAEAVSLIPGQLKLNLHASYVDKLSSERDRDAYQLQDFDSWICFAKEHRLGLDFNPTFFSHPRVDGNFTLASRDPDIRRFWIEHGKRCREIAAGFARQLGKAAVVNFWMPDGYKDICTDSVYRRELMLDSLDQILADPIDPQLVPCALESKLFGIGVESYTVSNHEFAYGYCLRNNLLYCLDTGHFHPTESVAGKLSAVLMFLDRVLLHVSRNVRWDSDHVVILNDELQAVMDEVVWHNWFERVFIGMDFFDASINRVAAWVIGLRNSRKALLSALLAPYGQMRECELNEDFTGRLAWQERRRTLPLGAVWDYYILRHDMPTDQALMDNIRVYEHRVQRARF